MSQEVILYGIDGGPAQGYESVAKESHLAGTSHYFIKYFIYGPQRDSPINPNGVGFSIRQLKPDSATSQSLTEFRKVSKECFDTYIRFLKTKNELFHRTAHNLGRE